MLAEPTEENTHVHTYIANTGIIVFISFIVCVLFPFSTYFLSYNQILTIYVGWVMERMRLYHAEVPPP